MTARLLVIALDAAESTLIERWAEAGGLPSLKAIMSRSRGFSVGNSLKTLPGAIWPELVTGISCGKRPHFYHPAQLHTGEAELRPLLKEEVDGEAYYWSQAGRAGLKFAAIDMPQTVLAPVEGLQLLEWGLHDRHLGADAYPAGFAAEVERRYGAHPSVCCDTHGRTPSGYAALLDQLKRGAKTKADILVDTMRAGEWDLFTACFGETHCVGHQFWHFQDPTHPWHRADAPDAFKCAIRDVYALVDAGIGRLIEAAGPDCTVIAVASHGMGAYTGGPYLLSEVLGRLGLRGAASETKLGAIARRLKTGEDPASRAVRAVVRNVLPRDQLRRAQTELGVQHQPLASPAVRAAELLNNRCGAIRLNLKGREPMGSVAPGNEETAIVEDIRAALLGLRHIETGAPIVETVLTAREAFGPDHHPDVPDLMVAFRDDMGRIEACVSPTLGRMRAPIYRSYMPRSGDHTVQSRIWIAGRAIDPAPLRNEGNVLDLAPTVLNLLNVERPRWLDGRPLL